LHEHRPLDDRSDELGGHELTHCPPTEDEHSALRHCFPAEQAAVGEPRQLPVTNDCSVLGQVQALFDALQTDDAGHEHAIDDPAVDVEPLPHAVQGAPPPAPP